MRSNNISLPIRLLIFTFVILLSSTFAVAHCDTMDGPVVKAAKNALETGNVNLVLIWVQATDEAIIKDIFTKTLALRRLTPESREIADMYFFETLVRIHRAGEGVPYTGLKPAGAKAESGIEAADEAIAKNSVSEALNNLLDMLKAGINERFIKVTDVTNFDKNDVEAGRQYVKAYVEFIHYVEKLYQITGAPVEGHFHHPDEGKPDESHN